VKWYPGFGPWKFFNKCNLSLLVTWKCVPALHVADRDGIVVNPDEILFLNDVDEERVSMGLDSASDVIGTMI